MLKLSWSEVLKWIVLVAGISSTYAIMQTKIATLEQGRQENKHNIERMEERMRIMESQISGISEKTTNIQNDVTVIKDYLLGTHPHE